MTGRVRLQGERPLKSEVCMPGPSPELKWLNRWQLSYLGGGLSAVSFSSALSHSFCLSLSLSLTLLGCSLPCPRSAHLGVLRQDINLNEAARPVSYQLKTTGLDKHTNSL